jgi:hypothetical protein
MGEVPAGFFVSLSILQYAARATMATLKEK